MTFEVGGRRVRDLNGNGLLDPYEDPRLPVEERVDDLLARMTIQEKAGLMFHPPIGIGSEGELVEGPSPFGSDGTTRLVAERQINHFNVYAAPDARRTAEWHNRLQRVAEGTRLGIPVTISSDLDAFDDNPATAGAPGRSRSGRSDRAGAIGDEELSSSSARLPANAPSDPRCTAPDG
jgi:beta-glucosidase